MLTLAFIVPFEAVRTLQNPVVLVREYYLIRSRDYDDQHVRIMVDAPDA